MGTSILDRFEAASARGDNRLSKRLITEFVDSFSSHDERVLWTRQNLTSQTTTRHELFEHIIFPVLLHGYKRADPWCIGWLEARIQNLYSAKSLWAQIEYKSAHELAEVLLRVSPNDSDAKGRVLNHLISWFRHCEHEWPAGILYGMDGATPKQCEEIAASVQRARALDEHREHADFLATFEHKVSSYADRQELRAVGK